MQDPHTTNKRFGARDRGTCGRCGQSLRRADPLFRRAMPRRLRNSGIHTGGLPPPPYGDAWCGSHKVQAHVSTRQSLSAVCFAFEGIFLLWLRMGNAQYPGALCVGIGLRRATHPHAPPPPFGDVWCAGQRGLAHVSTRKPPSVVPYPPPPPVSMAWAVILLSRGGGPLARGAVFLRAKGGGGPLAWGGGGGAFQLRSNKRLHQWRTYREHSVTLTPCVFLSGNGTGTAGTMTKRETYAPHVRFSLRFLSPGQSAAVMLRPPAGLHWKGGSPPPSLLQGAQPMPSLAAGQALQHDQRRMFDPQRQRRCTDRHTADAVLWMQRGLAMWIS